MVLRDTLWYRSYRTNWYYVKEWAKFLIDVFRDQECGGGQFQVNRYSREHARQSNNENRTCPRPYPDVLGHQAVEGLWGRSFGRETVDCAETSVNSINSRHDKRLTR